MLLPRGVRPILEQLEPVVTSWPISVAFDRVVEWLLQFDPDDYGLGSRIVQQLNVLGPEEIRSGLSIAYTRLQRKAADRNAKITSGNTLFAAIGDVGKSGAMVAYEFRIANELPEGNFADEDRRNYFEAGMVDNVVLIDDVIGTGDTAVREAKRVVEETTALGVKNVFVLSICGFNHAVQKVEEEAGAHAFAAYTYNMLDTASVLDGEFYSQLDHSTRMQYLERLKYYNKRCTRSEMGYGNIGALLAFRHNTPNVSLPVIWGTGNGWKPLFPRVGSIAGIERYYAQIEAAQREQKEKVSPKPIARDLLDLTILVEGRADELVMDILLDRYDLAKRLGVKSITVVAVGALIQSGRLFDLLVESGRRFIMVLDGDQRTRANASRNDGIAAIPTIFLRPNFLGLMDIERLSSLIPLPSEMLTPELLEDQERLLFQYELYLRRKGYTRHETQMGGIVDLCMDDNKFNAFIEELKVSVDMLLATEIRQPHAKEKKKGDK